MRPIRSAALALFSAVPLLLTACGAAGATPDATTAAGDPAACPGEVVDVVVSVGQWGDVVRSLAGDCATVTTVINSPTINPHDFEPTTGDIAAFSDADLVVLNGAGYDAWAEDAAANLDPAPTVLDLADVVGIERGHHEEEGHEEGHDHGGVNVHLWYSPEYLQQAAEAVTHELGELSPDAADHFAQRAAGWQQELAPYRAEIELLRAGAADRTYAATETVAEYLAVAVGLTDATPAGYRDAASNDSEPAPGDVAEFQAALADGGIDVLLYNVQTQGGVPEQLRATAEEHGVPVVEVTESVPEDADSFLDWQLGQLRNLSAALAG